MMEQTADVLHSVFVNGRSRPVIMEDMRARIERGDIDAERREAIQVRVISFQNPSLPFSS